jgi:hypothetical protein
MEIKKLKKKNYWSKIMQTIKCWATSEEEYSLRNCPAKMVGF